MLESISFIILLICLGAIIIEDFSSRTIRWIYIPTIFIASFLMKLSSTEVHDLLLRTGINTFLIFLLGILIHLVFKFVFRKDFKIDEHLGLGDILLFLSVSPLFYSTKYLFVLILGSLVALATFSFSILSKRTKPVIPLAGCYSMLLITLLGYERLFELNIELI